MIDARDIEIATVALALLRAGKAGASTVRQYLVSAGEATSRPGGAAAILDMAGVSAAEINGSTSSSRTDIHKGLDAGIVPIHIASRHYPQSLAMIADAPPVIFAKGNVAALQEVPGVAVVGTRKATSYGLEIASRISAHLSAAGWPVVSGLALGIDAAAHEGALRGSTPTIAVLAHGLERASPRANEPLALRILDSGGVWISEHPFGVSARPEYFVQRNRIQVGLSVASVIVEGELRSGSMTQAEYCLRYRRELFAVLPGPGLVKSMRSELPRMLIAQRGAHPIASRDDYPELEAIAARKRDELASSNGQAS